MFNYYYIPLLLLAFLLAANAQTTTTTTDANGRTVIGVISTNPQGQTTTRFSTSTGVSSTRTTTIGPGPVDKPAPTTATPGAPIPYTYTTVVNGVTQTLTDIFTPTSPGNSSVTPPATGTQWAYSSWYSIYGPPTTTSTGSRSTVPLVLAGLGGVFTFLMWLG